MGESEDLFEDLVDAGVLDEDDYDWWMEDMRSLGEEAYYEGRASSLLELSRWAEKGGWYEMASSFAEKWAESVDWWVSENEGLIWYDDRTNRWRSVETGKFVANPEDYIWGI